MGISLALLPFAIASYGAISNRRRRRQRQQRQRANALEQQEIRLETPMTDPRLLQVALQNCGYISTVSGEQVRSASESAQMGFEPIHGAGFEGIITGANAISQAEVILNEVVGEYTRLVQQDVYQKLKDRAAARGMVLEAEQLENDDSLVLTLRIQ